MQDLLDRILTAKPEVPDLSVDDTAKLTAYLKTHPHRISLSEVQRAKRGDSVLRDKLDAERDWRDHLKLTAEYNRNRTRAGAAARSGGDAQRQARILGRLDEPDRLSAIVRLRWLFTDTITRIETAEHDSHPSDLVVRANEIMELSSTLGIRPIPMCECEHKDSGDVHVAMNDPTGNAGCSFALWNPLDATGGKTVAMFLRMCRLWVSWLDGLQATSEPDVVHTAVDDAADGQGDDAGEQLLPDDGQCWVSAAELDSIRGTLKGTLSKWAETNPEIRRPATPADRERLKKPTLVYVYNERLIREKLGPDTEDE